jgi:predicted nucleotidyltransferase
MMTQLKNLRKILQDHKEEINKKYGVTEIGVFGSYVNNKQNDTSDIDILVDFNRAIDLLTFVNLQNYLSDLLKIKVDLVMKKALKPKIGQRILQEVVDI